MDINRVGPQKKEEPYPMFCPPAQSKRVVWIKGLNGECGGCDYHIQNTCFSCWSDKIGILLRVPTAGRWDNYLGVCPRRTDSERNLMVGKKATFSRMLCRPIHYEPGEVHRPKLKRGEKGKGEGEVKRRRGKDGRGRKEKEREEEGRGAGWRVRCINTDTKDLCGSYAPWSSNSLAHQHAWGPKVTLNEKQKRNAF